MIARKPPEFSKDQWPTIETTVMLFTKIEENEALSESEKVTLKVIKEFARNTDVPNDIFNVISKHHDFILEILSKNKRLMTSQLSHLISIKSLSKVKDTADKEFYRALLAHPKVKYSYIVNLANFAKKNLDQDKLSMILFLIQKHPEFNEKVLKAVFPLEYVAKIKDRYLRHLLEISYEKYNLSFLPIPKTHVKVRERVPEFA